MPGVDLKYSMTSVWRTKKLDGNESQKKSHRNIESVCSFRRDPSSSHLLLCLVFFQITHTMLGYIEVEFVQVESQWLSRSKGCKLVAHIWPNIRWAMPRNLWWSHPFIPTSSTECQAGKQSNPQPTSSRADTEPQDHSAGPGLEAGFENRLGTLAWGSTAVLTCMWSCIASCNISGFHTTLLKERSSWANNTVQQWKPSVLFSLFRFEIFKVEYMHLSQKFWKYHNLGTEPLTVPLFAWNQPKNKLKSSVWSSLMVSQGFEIRSKPLLCFGDVDCTTSIFK